MATAPRMSRADRAPWCSGWQASSRFAIVFESGPLMRVVHLGRSTCHAISGPFAVSFVSWRTDASVPSTNLTPKARTPESETRAPRPETRHPRFEVQNSNPKTRNPKPETGRDVRPSMRGEVRGENAGETRDGGRHGLVRLGLLPGQTSNLHVVKSTSN